MVETFAGSSTDDLLHATLSKLLQNGTDNHASRGSTKEICGAALELTNPRARLSRSEGRGLIYSCLGELCWYLSKSNRIEDIEYYIPKYRAEAEGELIHGGYGPRLFDWDGQNQILDIVSLLQRKPTSRRAVIQVYDRCDLKGSHKDIPCTCSLQFLIREGQLTLITFMRSNDVYMGLPHDIFCFTMLQELVARMVGVEVGTYYHFVGSLHLYDHHFSAARSFLREGWQSTIPMPAMPIADPWLSVAELLKVERALRTGEEPPVLMPTDPYWADLARLLKIFSLSKDKTVAGQQGIEVVKRSMAHPLYDAYINPKLDRELR